MCSNFAFCNVCTEMNKVFSLFTCSAGETKNGFGRNEGFFHRVDDINGDRSAIFDKT